MWHVSLGTSISAQWVRFGQRHMSKKFSILLAVLVSGVLLAACSETPSSFGQAFRGRSLDITVKAMDRMPQLLYSNSYANGTVGHHRLLPSQDGMELVLVRLSVANHTATNHIVDLGAQAVELQDFFQGKYFPVDLEAKGQSWANLDGTWSWQANWTLAESEAQIRDSEVPSPDSWDPDLVRRIEVGQTGTPPGQGFLVGSFKLQQGFSVDGWMIFETPIGTEIRSLRWRAGDTLTIRF